MPITLALQSQELSPLDLSLQGYVEDMYTSHVASWISVTDMPFSAVTSSMLERMGIEVEWLLIV
jgi:hypothetical protein